MTGPWWHLFAAVTFQEQHDVDARVTVLTGVLSSLVGPVDRDPTPADLMVDGEPQPLLHVRSWPFSPSPVVVSDAISLHFGLPADAVVDVGWGSYSDEERACAARHGIDLTLACRHCGEPIVSDEHGYWAHLIAPGSLLTRCQSPAPYGTDAAP